MRSNLPRILTATFLLFLTLLFIVATPISQAATASHIVISEVQVSGVNADDEFVELYNPTDSDIVMSAWRLTAKSNTGVTESTLVSSLSGTIKSHGYLLVTPQTGYFGLATADKLYSVSVSHINSNNTVGLYSDAGITVVDKVGYGSAVDHEGTAATKPIFVEGLERKETSTSTM